MDRLSKMYNFSLVNTTLRTFVGIYDVAHVDTYLGRPWPKELT